MEIEPNNSIVDLANNENSVLLANDPKPSDFKAADIQKLFKTEKKNKSSSFSKESVLSFVWSAINKNLQY